MTKSPPNEGKNAFKMVIEDLYREQEKVNASNIILRDFESDDDTKMDEFMVDQGFVKVDMPESWWRKYQNLLFGNLKHWLS